MPQLLFFFFAARFMRLSFEGSIYFFGKPTSINNGWIRHIRAIQWQQSQIIYLMRVPRILAVDTIQKWYLFRSELPIVQRLFKGSVYPKKCGSQELLTIEPRAPGLSCQHSDHWAMTPKQSPALTIFHMYVYVHQIYMYIYWFPAESEERMAESRKGADLVSSRLWPYCDFAIAQ